MACAVCQKLMPLVTGIRTLRHVQVIQLRPQQLNKFRVRSISGMYKRVSNVGLLGWLKNRTIRLAEK